MVTLRVPFGYVEFTSGCLSFNPAVPDSNCLQPFALSMPILHAMLPDFTPLPNRRLTPEEEPRVVHIVMRSFLKGTRENTLDGVVEGFAAIHLQGAFRVWWHLGIKPETPLPLAYKEQSFGLQRVGVVHHQSGRDAISLNDYLYKPRVPNDRPDMATCREYIWPEGTGNPPSTRETGLPVCKAWVDTTDFMTCTDEAVPTRDVDPKSPGVPSCEQTFGDEEFSSIIQIRYERQFQPDWALWKEHTLRLVHS